MPNRLANETSPYLLQHKDNPVDWHPWGEEAFERARAKDKPIFLSIGYSACHWCHVMEHESFEDEETARIMNEHFVNIKVDREERPDVDAIYMDAVQAFTGHGGWPMSMFLTPEGKPFYGGTYYPPHPRHGLPSFEQVLHSIAAAWEDRRDEIEEQGARMVDHLLQRTRIGARDAELNRDILDRALENILSKSDPEWGGFGNAPKFPQPMVLEFLLRSWRRTADNRARRVLLRTLNKMARGGMYDQAGGGFHRYSVDRRWLVPHFEKMLYDNAQLVQVYLHAWQAFGAPLYRQVVEETLDYVVREMRDPAGGFYSAQDADSGGEEGKFFVWSEEEIDDVLDNDIADIVKTYYDVSPMGNWEGKNILWVPRDPDVVAHKLGISMEALDDALTRGTQTLFQRRSRRAPPDTDNKVLTSWNALMLAGFAEAARVLENEEYRSVAVQNAEFLLQALRDESGRLYHTWSPLDERARVPGLLEDYAYLTNALATVYEATFDSRWLEEAETLATRMHAEFWDAERGGFFDVADDESDLILRPKSLVDNAVPAGNSMAATALLRLAAYRDDDELHGWGEATLRMLGKAVGEQPLGFGQWLTAMDFYLSRPLEFALVGADSDLAPFLRVIYGRYLPNKLIAGLTSDGTGAEERVPLLQGRTVQNGKATAYLCENFVCRQPTTRPERLGEQIEAALGR